MIRGHPDSAHTCYGTTATTGADTTSHFLLDSQPHFCRGGFCSVAVEYLHSWDTSYVASATCQLFTVDQHKNTMLAPQLVSRVDIIPNKCGHLNNNAEDVHGTFLCRHILKVGIISQDAAHLLVECQNKEPEKLACIGSIEFFVSS